MAEAEHIDLDTSGNCGWQDDNADTTANEPEFVHWFSVEEGCPNCWDRCGLYHVQWYRVPAVAPIASEKANLPQ